MAMQIAALNLGSNVAVAAPHELSGDRRSANPLEKKADTERVEASLPGSQKSESVDIKQTVSDLEQISLAFNRRLKFVIDQDSRQIIIKVIDNNTDKVIKVLPPEELQRLHGRIRETIGFLFDTTV